MARRELSRTQRLVRLGLLLALALLALALFQDRWRARPAVQQAYDTVAALNESMNRAPIKDSPDKTKRRGFDSPTTQADVQSALGRKPDRVMDYGPYKAEVYSWRGGLPWRTYDYYAVYEHGQDRLLLLMHYAYELPPYEGSPVYIRKETPLPPDGPVFRSFPGRAAAPEAAEPRQPEDKGQGTGDEGQGADSSPKRQREASGGQGSGDGEQGSGSEH